MSRILVVEDEESLSEAIAFLLSKEGFEVEIAATGPAAIEKFELNGADLILLDLMLPGLSGTEVCRQIRAKSSVPIIMLTAKDSEIDKVVGLELGADDYVTKPYSARELVARIKAVLRRGADRPSAVQPGPCPRSLRHAARGRAGGPHPRQAPRPVVLPGENGAGRRRCEQLAVTPASNRA